MTDRPVRLFGRKNKNKDVAPKVDERGLSPSISPLKRANTEPLPNIYHLDSRSFMNLFSALDDSRSTEIDNGLLKQHLSISAGDETPRPRINASSNTNISISPLDALNSHRDIHMMADWPQEQGQLESTLVVRGDSNASSASSRPNKSETSSSSNSSKRSSRSSFIPEKSFKASPTKSMASGRWSTQNRFAPGSPRRSTSNSRWNAPNRFAVASHSTNLDDIFYDSAPMDKSEQDQVTTCDKPLPPPPGDFLESVLAAMQIEVPAQRPSSRPNPPSKSSSLRVVGRPSPTVPLARKHQKSISGALTTKTAMSDHSQSPKGSRGARLGRAIALVNHKEELQPISFIPVRLSLSRDSARHSIFDGLPTENAIMSVPQPGLTREAISSETAEKIVLQIMRQLSDLKDLQSTALLSRGFYSAFKRNESQLVDHVLHRNNPAAWEFLHTVRDSESSPKFTTRSYWEYERSLKTLRSSIIDQCESQLQREMFSGLIGTDLKRRARIDSAIWRIWTFCQLFGRQSGQNKDIEAQVDWLNGGRTARRRIPVSCTGLGNGDGLSILELEDIGEMWHYLGMLLAGFHHRIDEARLAGIFSDTGTDDVRTEQWHLDEWISYLLALGPAVVGSISSCSFELANALELTTWKCPATGATRSTFLKAAITQAFQERVVADATLKASQATLPVRASRRTSKSDSTTISVRNSPRSSQELQTLNETHIVSPQIVGQIKRKPVLSPVISSGFFPESPDDVGQACATKSSSERISLERGSMDKVSPERASVVPSPTINPANFHSLSMTPTASTKLGATLFPMDYSTSRMSKIPIVGATSPQFTSSPGCSSINEEQVVVDPVDKAMKLLVEDLGFAPVDAKRALARCDTGFGMNVQAAVAMLSQETGRGPLNRRDSDIESDIASPILPIPSYLPTQADHFSAYPHHHRPTPSPQKHAHLTSSSTEPSLAVLPQLDRPDSFPSPTTVSPEPRCESTDTLGSLQSITNPHSTSSTPITSTATLTPLTSVTGKAKAYRVLGLNLENGNRSSNSSAGVSTDPKYSSSRSFRLGILRKSVIGSIRRNSPR